MDSVTNRWKLDESIMGEILIVREVDEIPIMKMIISSETGDGLLELEQAKDIAKQIIDDWNFTCDDLES